MIKVKSETWESGCYADDVLGYDHIRSVLADLVEGILGDGKLAEELRGPMSDDDSETLDALDALNEVTDGGYWMIDQGLFLVDEEENHDEE